MQNNPNNEIHTDYRADDIFKPVNANQLAKAIHYDFVITQEKIDTVLEALGLIPDGGGWKNLDLGDLIIRNLDGSPASWNAPTVKPPLNIFINGKLPSDVRLVLEGSFLSDSQFIDCSDFKDSNDNWTMATTKDMINIYSAYPYAVYNMPGGFNFWSTPQAPLIYTSGVSNNGVIKVGAYETVAGATTDFGGRTNGQIIAQDCFNGSRFTCNPGYYYDAYVPFVVYANWMQSGGIVSNYSIVSQNPGGSLVPTTSTPGMYQQMRETIATWNCEITLIVSHAYSSSRYQFCGWDSNEIRFSNLDENKIVTIYKDGAVSWKNGTAGVGAYSKVIISDFDITGIPLLFNNGQYARYATSLKSNGDNPNNDWDWAKILVLRNASAYITVKEDCPNYAGGIDWYYNNSKATFKFKNATELELYKWGAVFAPISEDIGWLDTMTDQNCKWWTAKSRSIYIDVNDLKDGIVYTVRVHTMILPFSKLEPQHGTPSYNLFEQDRTGEYTTTDIYFCDGDTYVMPLYWGSEYKGVSGSNVNICLNPVKETSVLAGDSNSHDSYALEETNRAELIFVKLNGSIYVMKY